MSTIDASPYINFQGKAREAMEFYQSVLGGTLELYAAGEQGNAGPAGPGDRIAYARLDADGVHIVGSDGHPTYPPTVGDNMAIALSGTDAEQVTDMFNALAEGGKIKGPLREQPWGGATGYLVDRFGINWVVTVEKA